jgi:hypothetical protein
MNNADRKRKLIAEGRIWRAEVLHAKEAVQEGLRPDSMARRVLGQAAVAGLALLRRKIGFAPAGINVGTLLPLVVSGVSALARRKALVKPVLRGAAIAGTVAAAAAFLFLRRKPRADDMETTASDA